MPAVNKKQESVKPRRRRIDWEAIERDYRTGQFSLRELEIKHKAGYSDIFRRAKKEGWTKDLRDAVKAATSAALIAEVATKRATEAQQSTTDVVLAAAEVNKQVILEHRRRTAELSGDAAQAKAKLMALIDTVADIREAGALAAALESLTRTNKALIEIERKAFNLDDDGNGRDAESFEDRVAGMQDELDP